MAMIEGGATRSVIAATKLAIPMSRRPLVDRPKLCARLDDPDYRLGVVSAPAGFGKTATLASWAGGQRERLAWLSCDRSDAEPTRFLSGLLASISATWPGVADDARVLLERDGSNTYDPAVVVANELATVDAGIIVVDDLHLAKPAPEMLTAFIEALPDQFRLVLGSRSDPPMSLARFRLRGGLLELRSHDLRFSADETAEFIRLQGVSVDTGTLERLHGLTEGWPAGVQLSTLALQRGDDHEQFIADLGATDHAVGDFLLSEVLDSLPADLIDFVVDTSVLETFDADLAAAVSGRDDAVLLLERLLAANLFVVELDEHARWYRYHHLFGSFLRARLAAYGEARRRATHERASRSLEVRGDVAGALQHAMAAKDVDRAGRVLRAAIGRSMSMSDRTEVTVRAVRLWLHEFGAASIETDPAWVMEFIIGLIGLAGTDDAKWWLQRVQRAHPDADGELAALIEGAWSEHHLYRGQARDAIRHAYAAMNALGGAPPNRGLLPLAYSLLARAHLQAGQLDGARAVLERAAAQPVGSAVADDVRNPGLAAWVAALDGDLSRAEAMVADVVRWADELELGAHEPGRIFAGLALVEAHVERDELHAATALLDDVKAAVALSHRRSFQSMVALQEAQLARVLGDESGAEVLLAQAQLLLSDPDEWAHIVFAEEAVLQALRFDPGRAAGLITDLDGERVETHVLRARRALLEDDHRAAAAVLADLPPASTRHERVERSVLLALTVLEHDVDQANTHLRDALVLGQPERLTRSIIDLGPSVHKLLLSFTPDARLEPYIEHLIATTSNVVAPERPSVMNKLIEPLSARELTVLRYLSSRLTYQEIAAALYVSLNTLKSHVKSVYRKLEVASRADAVDAGRRLRVI